MFQKSHFQTQFRFYHIKVLSVTYLPYHVIFHSAVSHLHHFSLLRNYQANDTLTVTERIFRSSQGIKKVLLKTGPFSKNFNSTLTLLKAYEHARKAAKNILQHHFSKASFIRCLRFTKDSQRQVLQDSRRGEVQTCFKNCSRQRCTQHIFQVEGNQVGKSYSFQVCSYFAIIIGNITSTLQLDFLEGV